MADRHVEAYKKSVAKCVDKWSQAHAKLAKQVADIVKQVEALKKQVGAIGDQTGEAAKGLGLEILAVKVPKDADQDELDKVPAWLEQLIKSKAASNQQFIRINPSADFSSNPNGLVVTASWFFPADFERLA
jgi:hypothetical protein